MADDRRVAACHSPYSPARKRLRSANARPCVTAMTCATSRTTEGTPRSSLRDASLCLRVQKQKQNMSAEVRGERAKKRMHAENRVRWEGA